MSWLEGLGVAACFVLGLIVGYVVGHRSWPPAK